MAQPLLVALLAAQAASDPALMSAREGASVQAARSFDQSFTIQTPAPADHVSQAEQAPPLQKAADYHFTGTKPLNGITIYTPVKGADSTTEGEAPTDKYGRYGKYAVLGGAALGAVGLALGGAPLVALALVAGLLIGAGAVLSFLFGKKKKSK